MELNQRGRKTIIWKYFLQQARFQIWLIFQIIFRNLQFTNIVTFKLLPPYLNICLQGSEPTLKYPKWRKNLIWKYLLLQDGLIFHKIYSNLFFTLLMVLGCIEMCVLVRHSYCSLTSTGKALSLS